MALLPGIRSNNTITKRAAPGAGYRMAAGDRAVRFKIRGIFKYSMLPGIVPRLRQLGMRMGMMAYILAMIFQAAGLLSKDHPMLRQNNMGRFGITDVVASAANNIVLDKRNIDKILIFVAIVMALIMVVIQAIIIVIYTVFGNAAQASTGGASGASSGTGAGSSGMFSVANPDADVVLSFLQQTVGLPGFFNSEPAIGFSIAKALYAMLGFYSTGMLIIAVIIVLYYVVTVVGEAAKSGQPFGGRFNSLWAPVRLVIALGMLVPFANGLNAAQYTILYTAKAGSNFASNAWSKFYGVLGNPEHTLVPPLPIGMSDIAKQVFISEICMHSYNIAKELTGAEKLKRYVFVPAGHKEDARDRIARVASGNASAASGEAPYTIVSQGTHYSQGDITLAWEHRGAGGYGAADTVHGFTIFKCGAIGLKFNSNSEGAIGEGELESLELYLDAVTKLATTLSPWAEKYAKHYVQVGPSNPEYGEIDDLATGEMLREEIAKADDALVRAFLNTKSPKEILGELFGSNSDAHGWGLAASAYMRLATASSQLQRLVIANAPVRANENNMSSASEQVQAWADKNKNWMPFISWNEHNDQGQWAMDKIMKPIQWADDRVVSKVTSTRMPMTEVAGRTYLSKDWEDENWATKLFKQLFMVKALEDIANPAHVDVFPMVHLANLGNELLNKGYQAFFAGGVISAVGGALPKLNNLLAGVAQMVFWFGLLGLGMGFFLAIVVPMMPFIYFFFAIVEWVMSIVEGLVGAPLWALAHLRIDGDGMPGPAAMKGYFILFGILIKPFLILFGLLASYVVFNAGAYFLNLTFGGVVGLMPALKGPEVFGFDLSFGLMGMIQYVGFLLMYVVIIYNLGMVCFKMIDQIPNQVMRWLGQDSSTFYSDGQHDPVGDHRTLAFAAAAMSGQAAGGLAKTGHGLGSKGASAGKGLGKLVSGKTDIKGGG